MLICDTGPIVAALISGDQDHEPCAELLRRFAGELAVPAPVVTEAAIFLLGSYGPEPQMRWLDTVASGEVEVLDLELGDHGRVAQICRNYQDLPLDHIDASVVALAERYGLQQVASIDHRHFSIVRLANGGSLELLPGA